MRIAEHLGSGALRPTALAALYETEGPFVSVYMNCEGAIENAPQLNVLRWRAMREAVAREGAEGPVLEAVDALIPDAHLHGRALAVIATARMPLHVEHLAWPVAHEIAMFRSLPVTAQLIQAEQARVRHIIAVLDRRGADIMLMDGTDSDQIDIVQDDVNPIRKVKAGGWSQPRYQRRAEKSWEDEAHSIADDLTQRVDEYDPRLVLVAGDVRMIELLWARPALTPTMAPSFRGTRTARERVDVPSPLFPMWRRRAGRDRCGRFRRCRRSP